MATNLWPNASIETGISEWTPTVGITPSHATTQAWDQTYSLGLLTTGDYKSVKSDAIGISESTQYTFSFYVYPTNATTVIEIGLYDQDDNDLFGHVASTYTADEWTRVSITKTMGSGDTGVKARFQKNSGTNAIFYIDGIMLETGASASEWADYIVAGTDVAPPLLTTSLQIQNPTVANSAPWDMGAYIYYESSGGVEVFPPLLRTQLAIFDPVVYAVDVPTAVAPPLLQTSIQMFNPTVNVGKFRNRICSLLHLIMRG